MQRLRERERKTRLSQRSHPLRLKGKGESLEEYLPLKEQLINKEKLGWGS